MNDSYEGINWLLNNSDWKDWEEIAFKVDDKIKVDEDEFWCSSDDFEIIDIIE